MLHLIAPATETGHDTGHHTGRHLPSVATQQMHTLYESINFRVDAKGGNYVVELADGSKYITDRAEVVAKARELKLAVNPTDLKN